MPAVGDNRPAEDSRPVAGNRSVGSRFEGNRFGDSRLVGNRFEGNRPVGNRSVGNRFEDNRFEGNRSGDSRPVAGCRPDVVCSNRSCVLLPCGKKIRCAPERAHRTVSLTVTTPHNIRFFLIKIIEKRYTMPDCVFDKKKMYRT